MVSAIASSSSSATRARGDAPPADGQATLARLQHQLSDSVNCASAKTPEGKATISAIEDKIKSLKDKMDGTPVAIAPASTADGAGPAASSATTPIGSTSGGMIDVYA